MAEAARLWCAAFSLNRRENQNRDFRAAEESRMGDGCDPARHVNQVPLALYQALPKLVSIIAGNHWRRTPRKSDLASMGVAGKLQVHPVALRHDLGHIRIVREEDPGN